jgi:hypothetical protein
MSAKAKLLGLSMLVLGFASFGFACGDDDEEEKHSGDEHEEELVPDCDEIREACHAADEGEGFGHDCHEVAHANDAEMCASEKQSCIEGCAEHAEH